MSCSGGRSNYGVMLGLCRSCGEKLLETNLIYCIRCGAGQVKLLHAEKRTKKIKRVRPNLSPVTTR
jgi:ribosomal protein L37E